MIPGYPKGRFTWRAGVVDRSREHFELRWGRAENGSWDDWLPVALLGQLSKRRFVVELLVEDGAHADAVEAVRRELDYYLIELGERDPWVYARYHSTTASNLYSSVHWSFHEGEARDLQ